MVLLIIGGTVTGCLWSLRSTKSSVSCLPLVHLMHIVLLGLLLTWHVCVIDIQTKDDVLKMGIDKYNEECRSIVMR